MFSKKEERKRFSITTKTKIFDNCIIAAPDGQLLSRCRQRKADWYLEQGLAELIETDPFKIRLLFEPAGRINADHPLIINERGNICVVCGSGKMLTKHHIVPSCFVQYLPLRIKFAAMHDIVVLCEDCHSQYEYEGHRKKVEYSVQYDCPLGGRYSKQLWEKARVGRNADMLLKGPLHEKHREALRRFVTGWLGREPNNIDLVELAKNKNCCTKQNPEYITLGQHVIEQIGDKHQEFFEEWRQHFVDTMDPKFMSLGWDVKNDIYSVAWVPSRTRNQSS